MEFIFEEIEVKTDPVHDHDSDSDTRRCRILKNDNTEPERDLNENAESSDPYFKFKLLVEELLVIFTKCEDKCGICVEYIVKLCQHIGQTHDNDHEHDTENTASNSSQFSGHPPNSGSRQVPISIINCKDAHTSYTPTSSINLSGRGRRGAEAFTEKSPSQNVGRNLDDTNEANNMRCANKHVEPGTSQSSETRSHVKKNLSNKSQRDKRGFSANSYNDNSCGICGKIFPHRYRLERHLLTHTGEKPFECETCGKCFTSNSFLKEHRNFHTGERPFKCDICDKTFCYSSSLRAHKQLHTKCSRNISQYNKRKLIHNSHKCLKCGKIFQNRYTLNKHSEVHAHGGKNHRFYCGVCGKGFFYNYMLANHRSSHTGERQVHCEVCGKYIPNISLLIKHGLSHRGEKEFNCNICGKSYLYKYGLDKHKLTHKPFDSRDLKAHTSGNKYKRVKSNGKSRKHSVNLKHKCLTCGKVYQTASGLTRHRVVHIQTIEGLKCGVCGKYFRRVGNFIRHMRTHNH